MNILTTFINNRNWLEILPIKENLLDLILELAHDPLLMPPTTSSLSMLCSVFLTLAFREPKR